MNRLPFRRDTKRVPLFGLGCAAGAAGLNRVADYLKGHPTEAAILLSIELCSLTIQRDDLSIANIIASGLFGDGGAAVLMVGDEHPLAGSAPMEYLGGRCAFVEESERVLGWDVVDSGFKIVLANNVADTIAKELPGDLEALMADTGADAPSFFVAHPGGPRVIAAAAEALGVDSDALEKSRASLEQYGNLSSAAVLFVLADTLAEMPAPGSTGAFFAFGPGFTAEIGLLKARSINGHAKQHLEPPLVTRVQPSL